MLINCAGEQFKYSSTCETRGATGVQQGQSTTTCAPDDDNNLQDVLSNSSLRRKLFFHGDVGTPISPVRYVIVGSTGALQSVQSDTSLSVAQVHSNQSCQVRHSHLCRYAPVSPVMVVLKGVYRVVVLKGQCHVSSRRKKLMFDQFHRLMTRFSRSVLSIRHQD